MAIYRARGAAVDVDHGRCPVGSRIPEPRPPSLLTRTAWRRAAQSLPSVQDRTDVLWPSGSPGDPRETRCR